ncbi:hypothetical protein WOLCODRAFT_26566 [Wolfiporia cocos MD-104 SS10]|uniref:Peptidase M50B-like-domain-containing protein n=1 Tax=Wolfiporia cocos (strain MD-104) TaxID=742152 RepID=A0A2H3K260_WOLCO|nr:hypothetical protein WOLCODRAFT_26566 [Wolfiporia cocos MD-104 SS10]
MSPITPISEQVPILYVTVVYTIVIFALWVIPGARVLINPLKLFTIGWHELCHIIAAILTGGSVTKVTVDPDLGGATLVQGGNALFILASGYIGSTIFGGIFVLAGFDILMAKIMSFVLGLGLIMPLAVVRNKITILLIFMYEGVLVGFWFVDHGQALRWYCLFVGVMNVFYVVWDVADDKYFRKANDSDATQFALLYPRVQAHVWAIIWILFEIGVLIAFMLLGIVAFRRTNEQMYKEAAVFLPT